VVAEEFKGTKKGGERKLKKMLTLAIISLLLLSTFSMLVPQVKAESQEDHGTVYDYKIISVTQTGPNEVTVKLQVRYCPACNPNDPSNPGCTEFTHGYPPPYYPYNYWCGGLTDGRYVAVRIKDATGAILGTQKLVCNPTNWPLNIILERDFVFSSVPLVAGSTIIAEADVYCSWCGHWHPPPVSLEIKPLKVVIDPGHSPKEPGYSPSGYPTEYDINRAVAEKLKLKLEAKGYSVELTKPELEWTTEKRAHWVNTEVKPDIFVSLHCNAGPPEANGTEVWIYDDTDPPQQAINELELAVRVARELSKEISSRLRFCRCLFPYSCEDRPLTLGVKEKCSPWNGKERICWYCGKGYWLGIPILNGKCTFCGKRIGVTVCPAVLVEMEFYSNPVKRELIITPQWQENAAQGIANGIVGYFEWRGLTYTAKSPVDTIITDPDGLRICKQFNEIPGATYLEIDLDGDGDLDVQIRIPDRKIGNYLLTVIPKPDALPTDKYTLEVSLFGESIIIAQNVQIRDIPTEPYTIISTETGIIPPIIPATIDFDPDTLNLKSEGKVVTIYIELPVGWNVVNIDVSTIRLNGTVPGLSKPIEIGDYDGDGIPDLMVKFDRASTIVLFAGKTVLGNYAMEVIGTVSGNPFKGSDTIRVIAT